MNEMAFEGEGKEGSGGRRSGWKRGWRAVKRGGIVVMLVCAMVGVGAGAVVPSVRMEIGGAAGWGLGQLGQNAGRRYSLVETGMEFAESSTEPNGVNARLCQGVFLATSVVVPVSHLVVLVVLWVVPMKEAVQRGTFVAAEVLNAWSAIEVFTVSVIAALLQIRQFAQFMIRGRCDAFNPLIERFLGQVLERPVCFDVVATIDSGSWLLLGGCVFYVAASVVVMRCCHRALLSRRLRILRCSGGGGGGRSQLQSPPIIN